MNSRQRRGLILLVLSVLCAVAAFLGVLSVINDVDSKVGPETTAYELKADIAAYQTLSADQFTRVSMPQRWLPRTAVTDLRGVAGKIAAAALKKGSLLQSDMVADQPQIKPGQQEIAVMIDADTGVPGEITPGDTVNIYATFPANQQGGKAESRVIVVAARVLKIGDKAVVPRSSADQSTKPVVPVTFALSTLDAQRIAYAESFATHVRLALTAPGGDASIPQADRTYTLEGDK